ncbi:MAG: glutathione synthase [Pseudomonadota bacterium]
MKLLFVADPLETFKTHKDSTFAMMAEAQSRGHAIWAMVAEDLAWRNGRVLGKASTVQITAEALPLFSKEGKASAWFTRTEPAWIDLGDFDAVLMRKDPPFDQSYLYATWLLDMAEARGARVFNRPAALRDWNEKLAIARFAPFTAPTLVSGDPALLRLFLAEQGDIVVKPLNAMGGAGVFRLRPGDPNLGAILETATRHGTETVMAQRYLPEIRDGDKRILLIDGEAVPFSLARIPQPGETRGNLAAGGTGVARPLTDRDREIATALGPVLKAAGLFLVGLDVIGDWLTEVNVTSPTCFREITGQTGCNVAGLFMDALEKAVRSEG